MLKFSFQNGADRFAIVLRCCKPETKQKQKNQIILEFWSYGKLISINWTLRHEESTMSPNLTTSVSGQEHHATNCVKIAGFQIARRLVIARGSFIAFCKSEKWRFLTRYRNLNNMCSSPADLKMETTSMAKLLSACKIMLHIATRMVTKSRCNSLIEKS